jgi:hypothetical protein
MILAKRIVKNKTLVIIRRIMVKISGDTSRGGLSRCHYPLIYITGRLIRINAFPTESVIHLSLKEDIYEEINNEDRRNSLEYCTARISSAIGWPFV